MAAAGAFFAPAMLFAQGAAKGTHVNTLEASNQSQERLQRSIKLATVVCLFILSAVLMLAQTTGAALQGTVSDTKGGMIAGAKITLRNEATGRTTTATADPQGHFSVAGLPAGTYTVEAAAAGFKLASQKTVHVSAATADSIALTLQVSEATSEVTVRADATGSIAATLAPMDALLDERSARTEITTTFIQNFTSPVADYGEAVEMAPGTFTLNGNGVGLGQSKTSFRGFPDGDYDLDFDGIPFYDTNSPATTPGPSSPRSSSAASTSTAPVHRSRPCRWTRYGTSPEPSAASVPTPHPSSALRRDSTSR